MTMSWVAPPRLASCMPFRRTAIRISASSTPSDRARPSEDVDAAEHDGRDDVDQLRTRGRIGLDGAEEAEVDDCREPGHQAGEREDRDADPRHGNAGETRDLPGRADRVEVAAEARRVQEDAEHEREAEQHEQGVRQLVRDVAAADVREPGRAAR